MSAVQRKKSALALGGDPARHAEFALLSDELAKLSHPACPDVDWLKVEQLCRQLFRLDGPQLQTAAAYALARSHLQGVQGMTEGIGLLEPLIAQWGYLWPRPAHARGAIVCGLFEQMRSVLRTLPGGHDQEAALDQLDARLARLAVALADVAPEALPALQALRRQCGVALQYAAATSHDRITSESGAGLPPLFAAPIIHITTTLAAAPQPTRSRPRQAGVWLTGILLVALASAGIGLWLTTPAPVPPPQSMSLDSLAVFEPGSSRIRPGSELALLRVLEQIKAQPGWWVVITGHADSLGRSTDNLRLSRDRAEAVGDWLRTVGKVSPGCLLIQGLSDSRPIADNDTSPGRFANRRVEVQLLRQVQGGVQSTCDQ